MYFRNVYFSLCNLCKWYRVAKCSTVADRSVATKKTKAKSVKMEDGNTPHKKVRKSLTKTQQIDIVYDTLRDSLENKDDESVKVLLNKYLNKKCLGILTDTGVASKLECTVQVDFNETLG